MTDTNTNALPLFYHQPVAFDSSLHGALSFPAVPPNYRFAANADVIPLQVSEVAQAIRHYPLVFLPGQGDQTPTLAALVGLGNGKNQFVSAQGHWRANTYIPAYVRRYPFVPMHVDGQTEPVLAIDLEADWVKQGGDFAFVDAEGKPTERLGQVMAFQQEYLQQAALTESMCAALLKADVLEPRTLNWIGEDGSPMQVNGLLGVEEARLKALVAESVLALHEADALGLAYAQLMSLSNLQFVLSGMPAGAEPDNGLEGAKVSRQRSQKGAKESRAHA
jgi:hypothetical protein